MMPDNAPRLWITGEVVHMYLPGPKPDGPAHEVTVPDNDIGWRVIKHHLRSRHADSRIGEPGDPCQHQINKNMSEKAAEYIRNGGEVKRKRTFTGEEIASALAVMRECGVL